MAAQLRHVIEHASSPHVEVRLLPFAAGEHASPEGELRIYELPAPFPPICYVDTVGGSLFVEAPKNTRLVQAYGRLLGRSLDQRSSIERLAHIADEMEKGPKP